MPSSRQPVVIILAAGRGERFAASGGRVHKLDALLDGKKILDHVLDAVRASGLCHHVVTADPARPGMGDSIAAGVRATPHAAFWLVLPGDLPLVKASTLRAVADAPACKVLVPRFQQKTGHPVRFDASCGPALMALQGPQGAASVLAPLAKAGLLHYLDQDDIGIVTDVDTLADLEAAGRLLRSAQQ
ncbi:MAG: nucleotidyltransferase family protein [Haliea sp.]|nr:MAG: nucleotidyltransferase family protein [Haliea sp.]